MVEHLKLHHKRARGPNRNPVGFILLNRIRGRRQMLEVWWVESKKGLL
jgi:hypothetical protein